MGELVREPSHRWPPSGRGTTFRGVGGVNLASEISRETTRAMPSVRKPADTNHRSQSTNQQRHNAVMHSLRKTRTPDSALEHRSEPRREPGISLSFREHLSCRQPMHSGRPSYSNPQEVTTAPNGDAPPQPCLVGHLGPDRLLRCRSILAGSHRRLRLISR